MGYYQVRGDAMMARGGILGTVSAISGNTITVTSRNNDEDNGGNAKTYTVDASNATITKSGAASTLSSVAVGDTVMVQGTVNGTTIVAKSINDGVTKVPGMMGDNGFGVFGTVTAISGTTLTITSKAPEKGTNTTTTTTYTVNAGSATVTKNNAASSLSAVAIGDTVMVQGTVSGTTVTAAKINDGMMMKGPGKPGVTITGNGQPVIGGAVTVISGTTLTVTNKSNVTYTVNVASSTVVKSNATSSASAIAVGDNVLVQGAVNGNVVVASSVVDSGTAPAGPGTPGMQPKSFMGLLGGIGAFIHSLFGFF